MAQALVRVHPEAVPVQTGWTRAAQFGELEVYSFRGRVVVLTATAVAPCLRVIRFNPFHLSLDGPQLRLFARLRGPDHCHALRAAIWRRGWLSFRHGRNYHGAEAAR